MSSAERCSASRQARPRLHAYCANLLQRTHAHPEPHLSLLLAGSLVEEAAGTEVMAGAAMFTVRPSGFAHQVRFGGGGALVISLRLREEQVAGFDGDRLGSWQTAPAALITNVLATALSADALALDDSVWDAVSWGENAARRPSPRWLMLARDRLVESDCSIGGIAEETGVHRVYFSRAFTEAFGVPPAVYRRQVRALRAAGAAIGGRGGADSAYACGFADQSHMARNVKEATGARFTDLRRLRSQVTSVQD